MVRISRTYTIEAEIVDKLKEEANASELINDLLFNYFNRANSKDLQQLKKQLDIIETEIDGKRKERDRKADLIRSLENQATENADLIKAQEKQIENSKALTKWLSNKVKEKEISFEDYRALKSLDNWEDIVTLIQEGKQDLNEAVEKAKTILNKEEVK